MIVLPLWPHDLAADKRAWIEAKAADALGSPVMVVPAVIGSPGRVLAFGRPPDFLCDSVVVSEASSNDPAAVEAAIRYLLLDPSDERVVTEERWLSAVMGAEVKEVGNAR